MKNTFFLATACLFFTGCTSLQEAGYDQLQNRQTKKNKEFQVTSNQAEEFAKKDYPEYSEYIKEKEALL